MMKKTMMAFAAMAAFEAAAITATKEYVDRLATNRYTKAETDARIVELAPTPDTTGVVHGDDRAADKAEFEDGLKFRASDSDGGNMRFRIQDPNDNGISWYSQSSGTSLGSPFMRVNVMGIWHPTDNANNPYKTTSWWDFSRAHTVLDLISGSGVGGGGGNRPYPISAGAFLDYLWGMQDLPSAAANKFAGRTMKAASNLVDRTGALVKAEDIESRAAQLTATSTVPVWAYSEWETDWPSDDEAQPTQPVWTNGAWYVWVDDPYMRDGPFIVQGSEGDTNLNYTLYGYHTAFWRTRSKTGDLNAYGLAKRSDITNTVTKAYVEGLGIESGIQEESDPVWEAEKGNYATKQSVNVASNLAATADTKATTCVTYLQGDDVREVVTNYDSTVHMPSRSLQQRIDEGGTNYWRIVWDEMTRWDWLLMTYMPSNYYSKSEIDAALGEKADRAWGFYDSHSGNYSPDGYTWISSPKIAIASGLAYQRYINSDGAVWVLESNGLVTETGGVNSNGFFRVSDDEGNALFEIVKGNKRTVGATANGTTVTSVMGITHMHIHYAVESGEHPVVSVCNDLAAANWNDETSSSCIANVTWTGSSGDWTAEVWGKSAQPSMFVKASYETGGETYIKNAAPVSAAGGILCTDGIHKCRPVYNNGSITWEVFQ